MVVSLFLCGVLVALAHGAQITSVPGYSGSLPSKQYGGYINVSSTKHLYYYFIESESNPASDPVVLWLNGGPGCSSFDGFVYEHGPFIFTMSSGSVVLTRNPYSWAQTANMLYVDSPAGIGLSFTDSPKTDLQTNDTQVAEDMNSLLRQFFQMFPTLLKNEFYISGESYAGVYVPSTAQRVVKGNANGENPRINLAGILVGNGVTDDVFDGNAFVPFVAGMSLISQQLYQQLEQTCKGNYWNATGECQKLIGQAYSQVEMLNVYDVFEPCAPPKALNMGHKWPFRVKRGHHVPTWHEHWGFGEQENPPCVRTDEADQWLNLDSVRMAIHAIPVSKQSWTVCTGNMYFNYTHDKGSMIPIHKDLLAQGKRILVYSGDHDMGVNHVGSEAWTSSLGLKISKAWHPWKSDSTPTHTSRGYPNQVGGYSRSYVDGLTYATIRGAGHMVPQYKPVEASTMFKAFIAGKEL